jgi:hypothetical protein
LNAFLATAIATLRPEAVVEVGVAHGASSTVILGALARNGFGRLHSIDLPMLTLGDAGTGHLVPDHLRAGWDLRLGPSRMLLPTLLEELDGCDVFFHDGDHTEPGQLEDFRVAWPRTRKLFVVDDICNPGFEKFADEVGRDPIVVACPMGFGFFGALIP